MDADSEKLLAQIIRNTRIASLATLRNESPRASMVAFAAADDFSSFYLLLSRLAQHTIDLEKNKYMSLLITETDDGREDPQTLARVSIRGKAETVLTGEPGFTPIKEAYLTRFPSAEQLLSLIDFCFWKVTPSGGRFIAGFAKAYNITADTLMKISPR